MDMPKFSGINRPYAAGEIEKTPQEKQRELDEKMKFLVISKITLVSLSLQKVQMAVSVTMKHVNFLFLDKR